MSFSATYPAVRRNASASNSNSNRPRRRRRRGSVAACVAAPARATASPKGTPFNRTRAPLLPPRWEERGVSTR